MASSRLRPNSSPIENKNKNALYIGGHGAPSSPTPSALFLQSMSTLSLPGYTVDATLQTPAYSAEPQLHETTLSRGRPSSGAFALAAVTSPPPLASAEFVKESKRGSLRLRLSGQASDNVAIPVFCTRGPVEGTLELLKPQDLAYVAVRVSNFSFSAFAHRLNEFDFFASIPLFH